MLLNNYKLVLQCKHASKIPISVYRSERTGLHVALATAPGPTVNLNICFVTETDTDDGLPHTLEHLVFMGSKSLQMKGALDLLALKAMAVGGTNAYTEQDHTNYDVRTIGANGMYKFIGIYLDHLLNPILNAENYQSEVYHVTPDGEEAGVVYSEMQEHEHSLESLVRRALQKNVFPNLPAYHVETGGRLKEIRDLCSLERVQAYHNDYYHLRNAWILLCGNVDAEEALKQIDVLDSKAENLPPDTFPRPFITKIAPDIQRNRNDIIEIKGPAEDEGEGIVEIGFLGKPAADMVSRYAFVVLDEYFTESTSAPLEKGMVLIDDPLCESVGFDIVIFPRCEVIVEFSGVPVKKLKEVPDKFFEIMKSASTAESFDSERIHNIIRTLIKQVYEKLEKDVSKPIFDKLIDFQLFATNHNDPKEFESWLNPLPAYEDLLTKPMAYWSDLVNNIFTDNCVVVVGKPDKKVAKQFEAEEDKRLQELMKNFEASPHKKLKLDDEIEQCGKDLSVLNLIDDVGVEKFGSFEVKTTVVPPYDPEKSSDLISALKLPHSVILHNVDSNFIRALFIFDQKEIPTSLRKYSMLFSELLFTSPATVEGELLSDVEVADLLTKEIMGKEATVGFSGSYNHLYSFYLEVSHDELKLIPKWTKALLAETVFEKKKIISLAKNLANGASARKREPYDLCVSLMSHLNFTEDYERRFYDEIVLENFHRSVAKALEKGNSEADKIISEINEYRNALLAAPVNLHLICNAEKAEASNPAEDWKIFDTETTFEKITIDLDSDVRRFCSLEPNSRYIKSDAADSSHLLRRIEAKVPYGSDTHVALIVFGNYLSMCEGLLWNEVRGKGFAYGCTAYYSLVYEHITLCLYRCSRPALAFEAAKNSVLNVYDENCVDGVLFDLAKKASISDIMAQFQSLKDTADSAAFISLQGRSLTDVDALVDKIRESQVDQAFDLSKPYFTSLFDDSKTIQSIVCPSNKVEELRKIFPSILPATISQLQYIPE